MQDIEEHPLRCDCTAEARIKLVRKSDLTELYECVDYRTRHPHGFQDSVWSAILKRIKRLEKQQEKQKK